MVAPCCFLFAALLLPAAVPQQDPAAPGADCRSCHRPTPLEARSAHEPFAQGDCQACHALPEERAGVSSLGSLGAPPDAAAAAFAGSFVGSRPEMGGSFAARHIRSHTILGAARDTAPAPAERRLLLRDLEPTQSRILRLGPDDLGGADFVWIRQDGGIWRQVPVANGTLSRAAAEAEPDLELAARLRKGVIGSTAVITVRAGSPVAAAVQYNGERAATAPGYFAQSHSLLVPVGADRPTSIPVTIEFPGGGVRSVDVRVADASARPNGDAAAPFEIRATLVAGTRDGGFLELWTAQPCLLEVSAPAAGERLLAESPSATAAAAAERNDPGARGLHPAAAPLEHAGLAACLSCHPGAATKGASHPLGRMRAGGGYALPENLPMGDGGQILCVTCHDPHGGTAFRQQMRMDPDRELCIECHVDLR